VNEVAPIFQAGMKKLASSPIIGEVSPLQYFRKSLNSDHHVINFNKMNNLAGQRRGLGTWDRVCW
jgi:hypothetical protein